MILPACAFAIVIILMLLLHILQRRAIAELERTVDRLSRSIDVIATRGTPAGGTSGRIARVQAPGTAAIERRRDPPPAIVERRTPAPMPAIQDRHTPTGNARLEDTAKRTGTAHHAGGEWSPTHRIVFSPDSGKPQVWLVAIAPAPYGHRTAVTHSEWAAGVTPAWHCNPDGSWSCHGLRTPDGARGKVVVEEFSASG